MANAVVALGKPEVKANGLRMTKMQVAIGLGRKARDNLRDSARGQVIFNNVAKEVAGCGWV
jgi:hypothetical protein